jgi:hypothetical protein
MTAAAAAKQRPRQLKPLQQPIPVGLDTKVVQEEAMNDLLSKMRDRLQVSWLRLSSACVRCTC